MFEEIVRLLFAFDTIVLTWPVHVKFASRWTPSNLKVSTRWTVQAGVERINWIEATKKHLFSFGCIELHPHLKKSQIALFDIHYPIFGINFLNVSFRQPHSNHFHSHCSVSFQMYLKTSILICRKIFPYFVQ